MKRDADKKDIKNVRREEMSRGRQPIDTDQEELRAQFKRDFINLLCNGNKKQFESFLIANGQIEGSEKFEISMKKWHDYQKSRSAP